MPLNLAKYFRIITQPTGNDLGTLGGGVFFLVHNDIIYGVFLVRDKG
jgi:hypothetical protein